ncbi:MAG TPA: TetR/AcrR family transcriptional regulator [Ktedonobacteraceae bacterium]|nr:TetR/AcrR family transcriptional regulator [Ktedonobacteraceae bacterium]
MIVQVARRLFMEYGYRAITTRQIADACGLTQPALYHYFKDKQDLYTAMAQEELARTHAGLERIVRRNEHIEERLRRAAAYLVGATQHDHNLMIHDIRYELSAEARALLDREFRANMIAPLAELFEQGQRDGQLRDEQHGGVNPVACAYLFLSYVSYILASGQRDVVISGESAPVQQAVSILLHGLANP